MGQSYFTATTSVRCLRGVKGSESSPGIGRKLSLECFGIKPELKWSFAFQEVGIISRWKNDWGIFGSNFNNTSCLETRKLPVAWELGNYRPPIHVTVTVQPHSSKRSILCLERKSVEFSKKRHIGWGRGGLACSKNMHSEQFHQIRKVFDMQRPIRSRCWNCHAL